MVKWEPVKVEDVVRRHLYNLSEVIVSRVVSAVMEKFERNVSTGLLDLTELEWKAALAEEAPDG